MITDVNASTLTLEISHETPPEYSFYRLLATDNDIGTNSELTFSILNREHVPFDLELNTGVLTVIGDLDLDNYDLNIRVRDNPSSPHDITLHSDTHLMIFVNRTLPFDMSLLDGLLYDEGPLLGFHARILIVLMTVSLVAIVVLMTAIVVLRRRSKLQRQDKRLYITSIPADIASGSYTGYQQDECPPSPSNFSGVGDNSLHSARPQHSFSTGDHGGKLENIARKSINRLSDNSERDHFTLHVCFSQSDCSAHLLLII